MFTGLIQSLGTLKLHSPERLEVSCPESPILADLALGDSIAVDGVCLTVEEILAQGFIVTTSPETLERTTLLHQLENAAYVNLEAALRVGGKLGGHFVTGHVDGVAEVESRRQAATSWEISFHLSGETARYLVSKGSIAVNGISLTVADCNPEGTWFQVAVIPHSFAQTNLRYLRSGSLVNLEADLLGKYAAKLLQPRLQQEPPPTLITPEFLLEHGFR